MGNFSLDTKRIAEWLYFCARNCTQHGETAFDTAGLMFPREATFDKLQFSKSASWTYFQSARDAGLLKDFADNGSAFYRFSVSDRGHTFIQENRISWFTKQKQRLGENVLTIAVAVLIALASQWALAVFGPTP